MRTTKLAYDARPRQRALLGLGLICAALPLWLVFFHEFFGDPDVLTVGAMLGGLAALALGFIVFGIGASFVTPVKRRGRPHDSSMTGTVHACTPRTGLRGLFGAVDLEVGDERFVLRSGRMADPSAFLPGRRVSVVYRSTDRHVASVQPLGEHAGASTDAP